MVLGGWSGLLRKHLCSLSGERLTRLKGIAEL
ncbi:MAG: hypothetical protein ACJAXW_000771 [Candidatus Azotimanducaceae bacterium]